MLDMLKWLPEQASTYAGEIDTVFYVIYWITTFFFLLVTGLLIWFLIKYRYKPGQRAAYSHGNLMLELTWTAIPAAIFIILFLVSSATWAKIKIIMPIGDVQVRLVAKQFAWEFHYPGPDGIFDTEDDHQTNGELHVPINQTVRVQLTATDVIHSFFVPVFRLKQDAVPGREIPVWFEANKTGKFEIPCAELCGPGHSGMKGWLYVHSLEDYEKWLQDQG